MIDATTGEILVSAKGEGVSKKGGGLKVGGLGGGGGAGFSMSSSDYKASAIGEAQEIATKDLVTKIVAKKDRLD
jgi:curli biogenesis system outer membrane secretion channel CsgG